MQPKRLIAAALLILMPVFLPMLAQADELIMDNGSRLIGTLVTADEYRVVFNTPFAGDITVRQENIVTIVTDAEVTLLMHDGSVHKQKRIVAAEDDLVVLSDSEAPVRFDVLDIKLVNPEPWRLGEGYKWDGYIDSALEAERGNTDTDELDLSLESIWRSLSDRYTVRGNWEVDESNDERNKFRWALRSKYDRFNVDNPERYYGMQAAFEHDEFADIDLRAAIGPYLGRQFFESSILTLQGEMGVVYVEEHFDVAQDDDFWGATWELRWTSSFIPGVDLYADQTAVVAFNESDNVLINSTVGARFPVIYGFQASAEANWKYDGGAVEDVTKTEEIYRFKLGYYW